MTWPLAPHLDPLHLQVAVEGRPLLVGVLHGVLVLLVRVGLPVQPPNVLLGLLQNLALKLFDAGLHHVC